MAEPTLMQFEVKKGFEFAGEEWRAGEILNVARGEQGLQVSTLDGKEVTASEQAFQSIREHLRNISPERD